MKYKFLEHTAEVKFQAFGKTIEEAFSNAVLATFSTMTNVKKIKPLQKEIIKLRSKSKESLLYDFIEELLFLLDTKGFIPAKIENLKITKNEEYKLKTIIFGDQAQNYDTHGHVKAITYSEMFIKEESGNVIVQVVLDV
ncbi:archease [Candidatus Woesearchaeota archaeon]|nr:archease [Candidatus Woesearchaeota archaeon]